MLRTLLLLSCCVPATAQATLVVDVLGGPGTFANVTLALATANPGDRIDVMGQTGFTYSSFTTALGVHLFGHNDAALAPFTVANLPAGQVFTAEAFQVPTGIIDLRDCNGRVHLEHLTAFCDTTGCQPAPSLAVLRCILVNANACDFGSTAQPAVQGQDSTLVFGECSGTGADAIASTSQPSQPALVLQNCTTALSGNDWFGGSRDGALAASPALRLIGGSITLIGETTQLAGGQTGTLAPAITAQGGTIKVDAMVTLQPPATGPAITGTATVSAINAPFATCDASGQAGTVVCSAKFIPQTLGILVLGLQPSPPFAVPFGDLWLQPGALATLAVANFDQRGKLVRIVPVPAQPVLRGLVVGTQALGLAVAPTAPALSNPAFSVLD